MDTWSSRLRVAAWVMYFVSAACILSSSSIVITVGENIGEFDGSYTFDSPQTFQGTNGINITTFQTGDSVNASCKTVERGGGRGAAPAEPGFQSAIDVATICLVLGLLPVILILFLILFIWCCSTGSRGNFVLFVGGRSNKSGQRKKKRSKLITIPFWISFAGLAVATIFLPFTLSNSQTDIDHLDVFGTTPVLEVSDYICTILFDGFREQFSMAFPLAVFAACLFWPAVFFAIYISNYGTPEEPNPEYKTVSSTEAPETESTKAQLGNFFN